MAVRRTRAGVILLGPCRVIIIGSDSDNSTVNKVLSVTATSVEYNDADTTSDTEDWPDAMKSDWYGPVTGSGEITCRIEWSDLPVKNFPTPKDFIDLLRYQNEKHLSALALMFNIYAVAYCRRAMNSKSGFLARAGWRKKRQ